MPRVPDHAPPSSRTVAVPTPEDVRKAWRTISARLAPTPLDPGAGTPRNPSLKLESLQPTGSFKVRGALYAMAAAPPGARVVTASAGNHALGVAYAARALGRPATVVVARTASQAKLERLRRWDVDVVRAGDGFDDAEAHALELSAAGAHYISAYNDPHVIAGQGTIGHELETQVDGPMTVVCGVGGGGLAAGLGLWASEHPDVRVVGVEAVASTALSQAVTAGRQVPVDISPTLADGLAGNIEPGSVTVGLVARHVDRLVTVTEDEICAALRHLAAERGYVAEAAGAVAVAALLTGKVPAHGRTVAVVSGRNITLPALSAALLH